MTPQLAQASIFYVNSTFPLFKVSIREGKNVVLTLKLKAFRRRWGGGVPLFYSQKIIYANPIKDPQYIKYARSQEVDMMTFDAESELTIL